MRKIISALLVGAAFTSLTPAHAAITPLSVAVLAPVQFPSSDFSVTGARLSLFWGRHRNVYGLDVGGIGNITEGQFTGIGVSGLYNYNKGQATVIGLQAAGITNINVNKARIFGVQAALGLNSNRAESTLVGLQLALVNDSPFMTVWGVQAGVYNRAGAVRGFQVGLVNVADSLSGIQIGLLNFNRTGLFSIAPIINIGF
jgi:hypothetical protein